MSGQEHGPEITAMLPPVPDEPPPAPSRGHHVPAATWRQAWDSVMRTLVVHKAAALAIAVPVGAGAVFGGYLAGGYPVGDESPQPPVAEVSEPDRDPYVAPVVPEPSRTRKARPQRPAPVVKKRRPSRTARPSPTKEPKPTRSKPSPSPEPTAPTLSPGPSPTDTGTDPPQPGPTMTRDS